MLRIQYIMLFLFASQIIFAQGTQMEFGKNRVQYHQDFDEWSQYETQNFITYWYGQSRNIGQAVVLLAEKDFESIQNILEHRMNEKIEIIVYKDLTDLKQSNIGSEEAFFNTGGQTKIVGNKIFVYFNGDHNHLSKQLREGIASIYLNAMLFGSNLQEIVQNAVMMNLPEWFKQGLVAFIGEEWNSEIDDQLRDLFIIGEFDDFDDFAEKNPKLAGHSFWYFVSQNNGKSTVSNLLYLTRINRSVESGFLYVLGSSYHKITESWKTYYEQRYKSEVHSLDAPQGQEVAVKNKRELPHSQIKISPNGQKMVYVANEIGKYKVYLHDIQTGERKVILKSGFRNAFQATDYEYPLLDWNPSGLQIAIIYEKNDVVKYLNYDLSSDESIVEDMPNQYQRIHSMDFINNTDMVLTASINGFSDIFIFKTLTRQTQRITQDFYDDLDATVVKLDGQKGILFASNRTDLNLEKQKLDSVLPIGTFDLFYYNLEEKSKELVRVSNTPLANERQAVAIDSTHFSYLSDANGIYNRNIGYLEDFIAYYEQHITLKDGTEIIMHQDSTLESLDQKLIKSNEKVPVYKKRAITKNISNYNRNILEQDYAAKSGKLLQLVYSQGVYKFLVDKVELEGSKELINTRFKEQEFKSVEAMLIGAKEQLQEEAPDAPIFQSPDNKEEQQEEEENSGSDGFLFQSEFDEVPTEKPSKKEVEAAEIVEKEDGGYGLTRPIVAKRPVENKLHDFRATRIIPYRTKFKTDYVTTQLDNSLLFGGLDSYTGLKQAYSYPPPGILLKANVKDLFEDYQIEGGVRIPTTFNGAEYFLVFDDKKKRLDKRYAFYRRSLKNNTDDIKNSVGTPRKANEVINLAQYEVRYPFDIFRSVRARGTLRFDKYTLLATDASPLVSVNTQYNNPLTSPSINNQRVGLALEYVFDNTLDVGINIKNGTRYKFYVEFMKRFQLDFADNVTFGFGEGFMGIVGLDGRHYQRLDKHSILALRLAGATSFGSEKILYTLGGVDNWLLPKTNNEIPYPDPSEFAFQTLTSNMRGFRQNIRNGNNFLLLNTELRVPIFKYFSQSIRSSFFRNFQMIGFFDVGTAWQGITPFSDENPINTIFLENPPTVAVKVNYFRDPIVAGYGFGIRTTLFGYFLRLDYAWGLETRVQQDPMLYFSMGMDF